MGQLGAGGGGGGGNADIVGGFGAMSGVKVHLRACYSFESGNALVVC